MKKTYISPELMLIELDCNSHLMQESLPYNPNIEVEDGGQYVKEDFFGSSSNVWDDDWDD